jgi:hypothetical protein
MRIKANLVLGGVVLLAVLSACVVGPGYDGSVDVGYVGGFYEPYGYDYGGWGGRYRVGPPRGGARMGGGRAGGGGRAAPSIPSGHGHGHGH